MSDPSKMEIYQEMIGKSFECAKKHHEVKFYTDIETLPYLAHIETDKIIVDTEGFYFVDDFKVYLLKIINEDEVLIDIDLFLFSSFKLEDGHDIYVDFKDESTKSWYCEYLKYFVDNGITEIIPNFIQPMVYVPNIGVLKIENVKLKEEYINIYYKIREWVLQKDKNITKGVSIILGQYLLGLTLQNENYSVYYSYNGKNRYLHFSGPKKFKKGILDNIRPINKQKLV
jgi:hypothetical protein